MLTQSIAYEKMRERRGGEGREYLQSVVVNPEKTISRAARQILCVSFVKYIL